MQLLSQFSFKLNRTKLGIGQLSTCISKLFSRILRMSKMMGFISMTKCLEAVTTPIFSLGLSFLSTMHVKDPLKSLRVKLILTWLVELSGWSLKYHWYSSKGAFVGETQSNWASFVSLASKNSIEVEGCVCRIRGTWNDNYG